jgi:hypothetical protein
MTFANSHEFEGLTDEFGMHHDVTVGFQKSVNTWGKAQ